MFKESSKSDEKFILTIPTYKIFKKLKCCVTKVHFNNSSGSLKNLNGYDIKVIIGFDEYSKIK